MRKKGFTLIELLVVIAIIAMLLAILMPALNKVKKIAQRVVCGTRTKGLCTAIVVYANDYQDSIPVQGGKQTITWDDSTSGFQNKAKNWNDPGASSTITVGASLYLLVREADVSPKNFVCPSSGQKEYDGDNTQTPPLDLVELWDFGSIDTLGAESGPRNHVSYAYQMPFGAGGGGIGSKVGMGFMTASAMPLMADKNPWMDELLYAQIANETNYLESVWKLKPHWNTAAGIQKFEIQSANARAHGREGQNIAFSDGHAEFAKTPDVGQKNDNIYTPWQDMSGTEISIRQGNFSVMQAIAPNAASMSIEPVSSTDAMLVNDDLNDIP